MRISELYLAMPVGAIGAVVCAGMLGVLCGALVYHLACHLVELECARGGAYREGRRPLARRWLAAILGGGYFVSMVLVWGVTAKALALAAVGCCLLGLSLVDWECFVIPNGFVLAIVGIWVADVTASAAFGGSWMAAVCEGAIGGIVVAGAVWALSALIERVSQRSALGFGDVKLLFAVGLFLGLEASLLNLALACIFGIVLGLTGHASSSSEGRIGQPFPFGPAIAFATWLSLVCGPSAVSWLFGSL